MKRKTLTLTLCLLACFAVIGVGFAAWIITSNDQKDFTGQIKVDTVTDARLSIEIETNTTEIKFGKPNDYTVKDTDWLIPGGDVVVENRTIEITFTVKKGGTIVPYANLSTEKISITSSPVSFVDTSKSFGEYIAQPTVGEVTDAGNNKCKIVITFNYGSMFGGANPYQHYNQTTMENLTDKIATEANTNLTALGNFNEAQYKITIFAKNIK